jgi:hypothetical protein
LQADIAELVESWEGDTPQVAVIGAFSSGKTTFLNSIFGLQLPVSRTPTTAVITQLIYGPARRAELTFRRTVRLNLVASDARSLDRAAAVALRAWVARPREFNVADIRAIDERGVGTAADRVALGRFLDAILTEPERRPDESLLHRVVGRVRGGARPSLAGSWEVHFDGGQRAVFDLSIERELAEFGEAITRPERALAVRRATVHLPDPRLRLANALDTAGLCSPVNFHKDVTAELLQRRPEKIVVLLDARRLQSPTNGHALAVLTRFVAETEDYRKITFGLTHWDTGLRTEMTEDSDPELDFDSIEERRSASYELEARMRRRLAELLSKATGVPCARPNVFPLAMCENPPVEHRDGPVRLWDAIASECSGWVGVEMWAGRWKDAVKLADELLAAHANAVGELRESEQTSSTDLDGEGRRHDALVSAITAAATRAVKSAEEAIEAQRDRMLTQVRGLDSKSAILAYLESGFWDSANESLNAAQEASRAGRGQLSELAGEFLRLPVVSMDRKTLGLDRAARAAASGHVSGVGYGLKSIWDFFLSGVVELTAENRRLAREVLREQASGVIDLVAAAVSGWSVLVRRQEAAVLRALAEKKANIESRQRDFHRHQAGLAKRRAFLERTRPATERACGDAKAFADHLTHAARRLAWSRSTAFRATLVTDRGHIRLATGQENDALVGFNLPPQARWWYLEVVSNGEEMRFWPQPLRSGVHFAGATQPPFEAPPFPHRLVLSVTTMDARIIAARPRAR